MLAMSIMRPNIAFVVIESSHVLDVKRRIASTTIISGTPLARHPHTVVGVFHRLSACIKIISIATKRMAELITKPAIANVFFVS
jgi:hypothetical protein